MKKSELKKMIKEEYAKVINEIDYDAVRIPTQISRQMDRVVQFIQKANLNRNQTISLLLEFVKALGIQPKELNMYITKIKGNIATPEETSEGKVVKNKKK